MVKNLPASARRDEGLVPELGGGHGHPLQYSCLEKSHGHRSHGHSPWGCKELYMTEHERNMKGTTGKS